MQGGRSQRDRPRYNAVSVVAPSTIDHLESVSLDVYVEGPVEFD